MTQMHQALFYSCDRVNSRCNVTILELHNKTGDIVGVFRLRCTCLMMAWKIGLGTNEADKQKVTKSKKRFKGPCLHDGYIILLCKDISCLSILRTRHGTNKHFQSRNSQQFAPQSRFVHTWDHCNKKRQVTSLLQRFA